MKINMVSFNKERVFGCGFHLPGNSGWDAHGTHVFLHLETDIQNRTSEKFAKYAAIFILISFYIRSRISDVMILLLRNSQNDKHQKYQESYFVLRKKPKGCEQSKLQTAMQQLLVCGFEVCL